MYCRNTSSGSETQAKEQARSRVWAAFNHGRERQGTHMEVLVVALPLQQPVEAVALGLAHHLVRPQARVQLRVRCCIRHAAVTAAHLRLRRFASTLRTGRAMQEPARIPQPWVGAVDLWILAPDLDSRARPSTSLPGNRRSMHAWQHDEPTTPASCQCLKSSPCRPAPATGQPDGPHRLYAACSPCASPGPP
jgi:hypothetical protein